MKRMRTFALAVLLATSLASPAADAAHDDGVYEQPVWFEWTQSVLDVLIVPPNHGQLRNGNGVSNNLDPFEQHPLAGSYLRAMEGSVADWDRAVQDYGSATLRGGLVTNVYVVGRDSVPQSALFDPEIVITTDESKATILGVAVNTRPCLVVNSKMFLLSMTYADMFNINAQEYGHCLGLSHVAGDASKVDGSIYKGDMHDPMNGAYPHSPGASGTELHCVSNLNVEGLEEVFRQTLTGVPGDDDGTLPVSSYVRPVVC